MKLKQGCGKDVRLGVNSPFQGCTGFGFFGIFSYFMRIYLDIIGFYGILWIFWGDLLWKSVRDLF